MCAALGEIFDPLGENLQDPYAFFARARAEEPVFFSTQLNAWVVTRYDDVREVLRQPEVFSSGNAIRPVVRFHPASLAEMQHGYPPTTSFIDADGEAHRRLRAPFAKGLGQEAVAAVEPFIRERAEALVGDLERSHAADGRAELMQGYAYPLPVQVIAHMFGIRQADLPAMVEGSYASATLITAQLSESEQAECARKFVAFQHFIAGYARERRETPAGDLTGEVVAALAPGSGPLTFEQESELVWNLVGAVIAGHATTTALIGNTVRRLLEDRAQWELLCRQPELVGGAVEEAARYDTSVQGFFRVTTRPVSLGGADLPAGAELLVAYGSANHDEALVDRAGEFDITRDPVKHLTFGFGVHTCAGARLARKQLEVTLSVLTRRLPGLRLVEGQAVVMARTLNDHGPTALQVTW